MVSGDESGDMVGNVSMDYDIMRKASGAVLSMSKAYGTH